MSPTVANVLQAPKPSFDTPLAPSQQGGYKQWLSTLSKQNGRDMSGDTEDYDMQGAYLKGAGQAANGHFTDQFKKPNHPTFSDESQYHGINGNYGGKWVADPSNKNKWIFYASPTNLKYRSAQDLQDYFKRVEPDSKLVLPPANASIPPGVAPQQNVIQPVNSIASILQGLLK